MNIKRISYLTLYNKCTWTRLDTGGVNMMNMTRRSVDGLSRLVHSGTEVQMTDTRLISAVHWRCGKLGGQQWR